MRYKADITAGALKLPESRLIADLLLRQVDAEGWRDAIVTKNVLRARNPATARRLTKLIRGRLETMGPDLWKLVRDGSGKVLTHAILAAAVKHSPLLGDFLDIVVGEQYRLFSTALTNKLWADYLDGCRERDPDSRAFRKRCCALSSGQPALCRLLCVRCALSVRRCPVCPGIRNSDKMQEILMFVDGWGTNGHVSAKKLINAVA
jgi:hypothetical protein